jgi:hypothetical protein
MSVDVQNRVSEERLSFEILEDSILVVTQDEGEPLESLISDEEEQNELEESVVSVEDIAPALNYEGLFSYLTGSVKHYDFSAGSYMSYDSPNFEEPKDDFFNPRLDDELIEEVLRAKKTKDQYGVEVYVNPMKKSLFDVWKLGNTVELKMRYDMAML